MRSRARWQGRCERSSCRVSTRQRRSSGPPSGSLEAYNAFLQGQFYFARETEADLRKAIESFTQATELDSRYALASSGLSRGWAFLSVEFIEGAPAHEAYAKARAAADRALALSPELAAAYLARGYVYLVADFNWRGAEAEYRHAMELAPNDGEAKFYLGRQVAVLGEMERAIELTREALVTEPLRANWHSWLATYLVGLNRVDEAERAIRRAIELQPGAASLHQQLAIIEIQRGNAQAALAAAQQEPPGPWQDAALALARQIGGDRSAADAALKTLIDKWAGAAPFQIAQVYALRNDAKETFAWLDRRGAAEMRGPSTSSPTPSSRATRTIRASPRSARRWACRRLQRLESGPESVGSRVSQPRLARRRKVGQALCSLDRVRMSGQRKSRGQAV